MAKNNDSCAFKTSIGGQALIEGIMMQGPKKRAIVCCTEDGFVEKIMDIKPLKEISPILGWPIIRGCAAFISSMVNGVKALSFSAEQIPEDMQEEPDKLDLWIEEHFSDEVAQKLIIGVAVVLGIALSLFLFLFLPTFIVGLFPAIKSDFYARTLFEGILKLIIFFIYLILCSKMKDMKRLFAYHGAEHKTIFCYEKGLPLTVENVRKQSRFHPRCGTSFLILMILVSIIFSTVVQMIFPNVYDVRWLWVVVKILLIPIICGAGFEILRICGKYDNLFTKILSAPGLWMQRITTKEPEDDMMEIAITALRACEPENPDVDRSVDKESDTKESANDDI